MKQKKNASSAGAGRRIVNEMRLRLPASSVNEGVARGTVGAFLAQLDPTVEELADLKCVVSEAVTNCVVHAYGGRGGAIYITVRARADREVELSVRDCGCGIADVAEAMRPMFTTDKSGERSGMGFAVMQAFADRVRVRSEVGKGTKVTVTKRLSSAGER